MPPRVDGVARHTSGLTVVVAVAGMALGLLMLPIEGALLGSPGGAGVREPTFMAWAFPVFIVVSAGRQVVTWIARTYTVTEDRLVIDEGVLTRHHRVVPFERVQQVDISRSLGQQIFGLAVLRIATAGEGGTTSVDLRYLDRRLAQGLRSHVLRRRAELQAERFAAQQASHPTAPGAPGDEGRPTGEGAAPPGAPPPPAVELATVGPGRLVLALVTGTPVLATVVVALLVLFGVAVAVVRAGDGPSDSVTGGVAAGLVSLAALGVAATIVSQILAMWDLRVEAVGDDLHLRHGLLEVRHVTVPRPRVQVVTVEGNPLQRWLGFAAVTLHSASTGHGAAGGATHFRIPHVPTALVEPTVRALLPSAVGLTAAAGGPTAPGPTAPGPTDPGATGPGRSDPRSADPGAAGDDAWSLEELEPRGRVAQRRAVVRRSVAGALLGAIGLLTGPAGLLTVVVGGALGALWGLAAHDRAGWSHRGGVVVLAKGALHHRIDLVPLARVQSARTRANPFQRRAGVAVFEVDVAGGAPPALWDLERDVALGLQRDLPLASAPAGAGQPP